MPVAAAASGPLTCGDGTIEAGGQCVGLIDCGGGTKTVDNHCIPSVACGDGTVAKGGQCVPTLTCGDGTKTIDGTCAADVTCGDGTTATDGKCTPDIACGTGTHAVDGLCIPVATGFLVRTSATTVVADGKTTIDVFAIGSNADGSPALDDLVFTVAPTTAGTFATGDATLTATGFTMAFTPCSSADAACTGTFQISVAKKADPTTILATTGALTLAAPPPAN